MEHQIDFMKTTFQAKIASKWTAEKMGYTPERTEAYIRTNVANIVRENHIGNMIARIENDLFKANIDMNKKEILQEVNKAIRNELQHNEPFGETE